MNIYLAGVGGQGILLASEIISLAALKDGYDVKKSEIHGLAQRGGAVSSSVRFAKKVFSPVVDKGNADIILAFEKLEGLRAIEMLKENGIIILNNHEINPLPVASGMQKYPKNIIENLKSITKNLYYYNAYDIAKELGNIKVVNTILLGSLAKLLEKYIKIQSFKEAVKERVPAKTIDINMKAFEKGYNLI